MLLEMRKDNKRHVILSHQVGQLAIRQPCSFHLALYFTPPPTTASQPHRTSRSTYYFFFAGARSIRVGISGTPGLSSCGWITPQQQRAVSLSCAIAGLERGDCELARARARNVLKNPKLFPWTRPHTQLDHRARKSWLATSAGIHPGSR